MTTGFVSIRIPNGTLEGNFVEGVLINGTLKKMIQP